MTAQISYPWAVGIAQSGSDQALPITPSNPLPMQLFYADALGTTPILVNGANPLPTTTTDDTTEDPQFDGRGRQRVVQPLQLFQSSFQTGLNATDWSDPDGVASFTAPYVDVVGAGGGENVFQTRRYFQAQMGATTTIMMSGVLQQSAAAATDIQRFGYFDDQNGFFFQAENGVVSAVVRSAGVDTVSAAPSPPWSTIDAMDGAGPSGLTLDDTARNAYYIEIDWMGAGQATFGIVINRRSFPMYRIDFANSGVVPETGRISLPLRVSVDQGSTASAARLFAATISIDGGAKPKARRFGKGNAANVAVDSAGTPEVGIVAVRPGIGSSPRIAIEPVSVKTTILKKGNVLRWRLYRVYGDDGTAVTGGAWAASSSTSVAEVNETMTAITLPGARSELVAEWYGDKVDVDAIYLACGYAVTEYDILIVTAQHLSGAGIEEVRASVEWREVE